MNFSLSLEYEWIGLFMGSRFGFGLRVEGPEVWEKNKNLFAGLDSNPGLWLGETGVWPLSYAAYIIWFVLKIYICHCIFKNFYFWKFLNFLIFGFCYWIFDIFKCLGVDIIFSKWYIFRLGCVHEGLLWFIMGFLRGFLRVLWILEGFQFRWLYLFNLIRKTFSDS